MSRAHRPDDAIVRPIDPEIGQVVALERFGDALALIAEDGEQVSYAALAARADAFAARLGAARRVVMIEMANDAASVVALLGVLRSGHVALPVAEGESARAIEAAYAPSAVLRRSDGDLDIVRAADEVLHPDLALLLSTSGSTGSPKLVRLSLASLQANAAAIATYLELGANARAITSLPLYYSYGLSVLTSHLAVGGSIVLTDTPVANPEFRALCDRHAVTGVAGVPYTYELLERSGWLDDLPRSITMLTQAGGRLPPDRVTAVAKRAAASDVRFYVMYGQTEATARMAYLPPERTLEAPEAIGIAIPGGRFRLIDGAGMAIEGAGVEGELVYDGPSVMLGYALSAGDLALGRELDALHTGDLAMRGDDGLYRITGRKSRFVKLFGLRIGLDDIERLYAERGIAAVATGSDEFVALQLPESCAAADETGWLSERLGIPPHAIEPLVGETPRLPSGKPDYAAILREAGERRASAAKPADSVIEIFARAFPFAALAPSQSFLDLGGDSLTYVDVSIELEELIGSQPAGWEEMSIAALEALPRNRRPAHLAALRTMDSEVVVRALAIMAVVVNHASNLWTVGGGANALLMLFGFSFARYQQRHLDEGRFWQPIATFARNIVAPYYLLALAYMLAKRELDVPTLLLVSNFHGRFGSLLEPFWFIETCLQCLVILTAIFLLPIARRSDGRDGWRFAFGLLVVSLAISIGAQLVFPRPDLEARTPEFLFWFAALGVCLRGATGPARKFAVAAVVLCAAVSALALPTGAGAPLGAVSRILWLVGAVAVLLWMPRVVVPLALRATLQAVAAASFYIYLTHNIVVHVFLFNLKIDNLAIILIGSILAGMALRWLITAGLPLVIHRGRRPVQDGLG